MTRDYICHLCDFVMGQIGHQICVPNLKSILPAIAGLLKENPQLCGAPLTQGHAHFSSACDFMISLGKLKLHTKFEVASVSRINSNGKPQNFRELS